ncbi:MAG: sigma-54-dependent Fis family transcriptional regulator [Planctomycetes bacterium]|nr:sigma-54-dependent Fis family transcriptional regulator [Planctomycetota bacterium]
MLAYSVLVVDDEKLIRWSVRERLQQQGIEVVDAENGAQARQAMGDAFDLVLLDVNLPDTSGIDLIPALRDIDPDVPIIMMTGDATAETAVAAMKAGAFHYCTKPMNLDELALLAVKAIETTRLRREVRQLHAKSAADFGFDHIVGNSPAMKAAKSLMGKIARSPSSTVLITGESGTGKDLAAKAVHYNSARGEGPFVNITCSALPDALLESELFGHEKGAFTDARALKKGLFEQAEGGTVFLDEIGEMSPILQAKLLRFLEEKSFRRVGGNKDLKVDVRVIAATNRELQHEVKKGGFREDLFYRLNVLTVELPPLRDRVGDIPLLAEYFAHRFSEEFRKPIKGFDKPAIKLLTEYTWPGNVREFRNAIERAVLLCDREMLCVESFGALKKPVELDADLALPPAGVKLDDLERSLVVQALERTNGNQTQAAKLLGLNRDQIRYRIEKFHLK